MSQTLTVDVSRRIEAQGRGGFVATFIVIAASMTLFDGYDLGSIAFAAPSMMRQWHIDKGSFSHVFTAGLIGMLIGCIGVGFFSDRWGRKPSAIGSVLAFGIGSLLTLLAVDVQQVEILRFVAGLGLGGLLPMIFTLSMEFVPQRMRATAVTLALIGFNLGSMAGGIIAAALIPRFGWHIVYWIAGIGPLVVGAVMTVILPESIRFMVSKKRPAAQVAAALQRIDPTFVPTPGTRFVDSSEIHADGYGSVRISRLFEGRLRFITPLLWLSFFFAGTVLFLVLQWTPTLGESEGIARNYSALALTAFSLGTMSAGLATMRLIDWHGAVVAPIFPLIATPVLLILGFVTPSGAGFVALMFFVGLGIGGGFNALNALSGFFYRVQSRGAGVSWANAATRVGGIVGPTLAGMLFAASVPTKGIYLLCVVPTVLFIASAFGLGWFHRDMMKTERADSRAVPVEAMTELSLHAQPVNVG